MSRPYDDAPEADEAPLPPSKSARKREAHALQKLGEQLIGLAPADLATLPLTEALLDAIQEARRLKSRAALSRQRQYIGKLMREVDPEPIEAALAALIERRNAHARLRR
jgi:ribosome-associated protein